MKAVFTGWACCVMAGQHVWQKHLSQSGCMGAPMWGSDKSVKQSCGRGHTWWERWSRIRREEKARGWKGAKESCLLQLHRWCSRWDGKDGWIRSQRKREMTQDHVFDSLHKEHWIGKLPKKTQIFILWLVGNFFLLEFVSKKNGWGDACEILIPLQWSGVLKGVKLAYGEEILRDRTLGRHEKGRNSEDRREDWRKRRKIILWGAHESAFARQQYLNGPDFVLCKLIFQGGKYDTHSVYQW